MSTPVVVLQIKKEVQPTEDVFYIEWPNIERLEDMEGLLKMALKAVREKLRAGTPLLFTVSRLRPLEPMTDG